MENLTSSFGFFVDFIDMVNVGFLYIGASSCGLEGFRYVSTFFAFGLCSAACLVSSKFTV
jgi:hypothetical protein